MQTFIYRLHSKLSLAVPNSNENSRKSKPLIWFSSTQINPQNLIKSTLISAQKYILPPHNPKRELKRKGRAGDRGDLYIDAGLTKKKNFSGPALVVGH